MADEVGKLSIVLSFDSKSLDGGMKEVEAQTESVGNKLSGVGAKIGAALAAAGVAAVAAVGKLTSAAVKAYADYEQLAGGVETLFKDSASDVMNYATTAYKTAGLSANQYMEQATSFSARLLQGLNGDTAKAAQIADVAISDMADNANKMGTAIGSIQDAYQGFAKQNYTMLDNLKLGYGGTASEMARLINDSGVLGDTMEVTANTVNDVSFDKMIEAIHVVQENMGITGTTAMEAATTISGSLGSMRSAWENLITYMGGGTHMAWDDVFPAFIETVKTFASNVIPVIQDVLNGIAQLIAELAPVIASALPDLVSSVLPGLINAATEVIVALAQALPDLISGLIDVIIQTLPQVMDAITNAIPAIVDGVVKAIMVIADLLASPANIKAIISGFIRLMMAIVKAMPQVQKALIEALPVIIDGIVEFLTDPANIAMLLAASVELLMATVTAVPQILEALVNAFGSILGTLLGKFGEFFSWLDSLIAQFVGFAVDKISQFISGIAAWFSQLPSTIGNWLNQALNKIVAWVSELGDKATQAGSQFLQNVVGFFANLPGNIWGFLSSAIGKVSEFVSNLGSKALEAGKLFVSNIVNTIKDAPNQLLSVGKNIVEGIWNGISGAAGWLASKIREFCGDVIDNIKDFFGINSPSTVFRDEVGTFLAQGIGVGFEQEMASVNAEMEHSITASVDLPGLAGEGLDGWLTPIFSSLQDNDESTSTAEPLTVIQNNTINDRLDIQQVANELLNDIRSYA